MLHWTNRSSREENFNPHTGKEITSHRKGEIKVGAYILEDYYMRYLKIVRGLSDKTLSHYKGALNTISRLLKEKGLISNHIFEISDVETLEKMRDVLFSDPDFNDFNVRGHQMYSAGLNNYLKYANCSDFGITEDKVLLLDIPVAFPKNHLIHSTQINRSSIIRNQVIEMSKSLCEIDPQHESFIAEKTKKPYMEGHHAIALRFQAGFDTSLDVYANIVCLCPVCHRRIHYGLNDDRIGMMNQIYDQRSTRLSNSGIHLSKDEFARYAV